MSQYLAKKTIINLINPYFMKTFKNFIALFVLLNAFAFTSCTTNDTEEDQLTITAQDTFAGGEDSIPPAGKD